MENFVDQIIDYLADGNCDEEAREKMAEMLAAHNPELALKIITVTEKIYTAFAENLNEVIKNNSDNMMLGLMCHASVTSSIKTFKSSITLQAISGLDKSQYDLLVDKLAERIMKRYFE